MTALVAEKKPGRNDPCPCGSGKKYKKCHGRHGDMKPRSREVYIGFGEKFGGMTVSEAGDVLVHTLSGEKVPADAVFSQAVYTKDSGKSKVLNLAPGKFAPNIGAYLLSFNAVCAIDTNTRTIRGERISIGCLVESYSRQVSDEQAVMDYRVHGIMAFKNAADPEKFAWSKVVSMITQGPSYSETVKIGMIIDHDLGNHAKYMARELPIYKGTFLPATITLIYSSTDAGKEDVTNFLLSLADKQAADILHQLEETGTAVFEGKNISLDSIQDAGGE